MCLDVVGLAVLPKLEKNFCERVSDVSCLWMGYGGSSMVCLCGVPVQLLLVDGGRVGLIVYNASQGRSQEFLFGGGQVATLIYL